MSFPLAIVIPAYKLRFFQRVLDSLAAQTDKRFTLYVGIDGVDADFESVAERYADRIPMVVRRFADNMGSHDLVGQWHRCIDMIGDEEWIWLFSDDDMLQPGCVEAFYRQLESDGSFDLYHFDVDIIDSDDRVVKSACRFPAVMDALDFLKRKNSASIDSFVVEYIFRRSAFERLGRFEQFDMAWGSDIATWAKLGRDKGIATIAGPRVLWRSSDANITPSTEKAGLMRKLSIYADYMTWCRRYFRNYGGLTASYHMFRMIFHYTPYLSKDDAAPAIDRFYDANPKVACGKLQSGIIKAVYPLLGKMHSLTHRS